MKNTELVLDPRLSLAASFVRGGVPVCDVGTDHGYLPVSLLLDGKIPQAFATDINASPLSKAKENASRYGVFDKIGFFLTDGLCGVPLIAPCDIVICGMGGELIASIIGASDIAKNESCRLILQPMTKPEALRAYLSDGFEILDEGICQSAGKLYQCVLTRYSGKKTSLSPAEALIGKINIARGRENPLFEQLVARESARCEKEISGRKSGGLDTTAQEKLLSELLRIKDGQI